MMTASKWEIFIFIVLFQFFKIAISHDDSYSKRSKEIIKFPNGNQERILNQRVEDNPITCENLKAWSNTEFAVLKCSCNEGKTIENLDPSYLGDTMQHNMEKITFENCIFQKIQAFTFENFQNLKEIEFKSSHFEIIDKDAFKMSNFPHPGFPILELSFKNISMSDSKPLILSNVVLKNWHTDMFQSNVEGKIEISNSNISAGIVDVMNEKPLDIKSMKFKQVNFVNTKDLFFKVRTSEEIVFENCDFKFHKTPAINVIYAKEVKFNKCKLELLDETSVKISADYVEFINTTLKRPLDHSLNEMIGASGNSTLKMLNVTLIYPSQAIFIAKFSNFILKNIFVESIKCETMCEILQNLACTDDFEINHNRLIAYVPCQNITDMLRKETHCKKSPNTNYQVFTNICKYAKLRKGLMEDPANQAIVSVMACLVAIIFIIAGLKGYKWYLEAANKKRMMRKWKVAYPATTVHRPAEVVSFNLENIQYISRPTSRVFHNNTSFKTPTEEKSVEHKWFKAAKRNSYQPDLVRECAGAFASDDQNVEKIYEGIAYVSEEIETVKEEDDDNAFEDVSLDENDEISNSSSHAENPIQNRFSFLRKKSVMIRKKSGNPPPPSYRSLYMEKDELS